MQKEIKELYPKWVNEINSKDYNLILSNDMDSLLSCAFLKHHFNLEVNAFCSFASIAHYDATDQREPIGVDLALKEGKAFDNHMTRLNANSYINAQSANINNVTGINRDRYTDKFAMSTLIQLYAIYDVPLPTTLQGKLILLCVDVGFKGYYDNRYQEAFLSYLKMFDMMELVDVLERFTLEQMYEFMLRAELDLSIHLGSNCQLVLSTSGNNPNLLANWNGIDFDWYKKHLGYSVELPKGDFAVSERFEKDTIDWNELDDKTMQRAYSYAFINTNRVMISMRKKGESE